MKLGLVLSNDWELFGDGSGDYFDVQHKPLQALLNTVEQHGAKLTVMAEVGQQWAHHKIADREPWARNVVEGWEAMLRETVKRHHDVQLHLHPQWLNAEYKHGKWKVDLTKWAISSLPPDIMADVLERAKVYLENTLQPVDPGYECIAFRAGAYCVEPSTVTIRNLVKAGITCDTSVTKGMHTPQFFDYRDAHSNIVPWFVRPDSVKYKTDGLRNLLEIPIHSYEMIDSPILREFIWPRLFYLISTGTWLSRQEAHWILQRARTEAQRYPFRDRPFMTTRKMFSPRWLLSKLIGTASIQLDYDILPAKVFVRRLQSVLQDDSTREYQRRDVIIPIMASGHVKRIHSCDNISRILDLINEKLDDRVTYWNLRDAVRYWAAYVASSRLNDCATSAATTP